MPLLQSNLFACIIRLGQGNVKAEKDTVLAALTNVNCNYLVGDVAAVKDILAAGGDIYLDESLVLDDTHLLNINTKATLNLGSSSLNTSGVVKIGDAPITIGAAGVVTIQGGSVEVAGEGLNFDGQPTNFALLAKEGSTLTINDTYFDNTEYNSQIKLEAVATLNNVTIKATKDGVSTRYDAYVTLNNVTINMVDSDFEKGYGSWVWSCNTDHNDGKNATVVINSGTYTRENMTNAAAVTRGGLQCCGGTIEVKGGTFTAADGNYFGFESAGGKIVIKGGTFGDKTFGEEGFNEAYLLSLCVKVGDNDNADVYSVTKDPETGYFTITRK